MARKEFLELAQQLAIALDGWNKTLQPALTKFTVAVKEYQPRLEEILSQTAKVFKQLPEWQLYVLEVLAKDGWYLDEEMGLAEISEAIELYKSGNIKQARGIMCQHFTAREETFSTRLSEQFPERAEIFNAAIGAHLRGEYALSVPVFLAQADGICAQCMGVQLYSKDRKGVSRLAEHQEVKNLDPLLMPFFYPLTAPMPITASQKERFNSFDALNRHAVLHGEDVSYNTQLNSCRALSLLIYTAWVFRELEDFKSSQLKLQTNIEKAKLQPRRNKLIRPD